MDTKDTSQPSVPLADDDRIPGERLKGESDKAFKAWCAYRDMDAHERSILAAQRVVTGRADTRFASSTFQHWCAHYGWVERAAEWDEYLDEKKRIARVKKAEENAVVHGDLADRLVRVALAEVTKLHNKIARDLRSTTDEDKERTRVPVKELARLADIGVKLQRLINGDATDIAKLDAEVEMTYTDLIAEAAKLKR